MRVRREYGKPHFKIGITEVYLALVQSDRGKFKAALANMDDAKHNYDASYGKIHLNHGDLLVSRATVLALRVDSLKPTPTARPG